ncbi:MAG: cellulase family glycosylhydrolase [Candidatus Goldbacteria bacterium]|nr:cellulase family glycosylhydrolase [Candidatus Goldiibacteriota bacterium]
MKKYLTGLMVILIIIPALYATPVSENGELKLVGNQLSNSCGNPVQLKGISSMGLQWYGVGQCLDTNTMDYMVNTIGIDVFRAAMYVDEGGYLTDKTKYANMVNTIVDWCEARGVYVIIDWHMLNPGDPNISINDAKTFWAEMSSRHKGKKHVLYEICNEPNGVSWSTVKNYADTIIPIIRANDPDTIIIVGTPNWSQLGTDVVNNKLNYSNIMYTFHFYAASHSTGMVTPYTDKLPIFCTEWGISDASGNGAIDTANATNFLNIFNGANTGGQIISWAAWSWCDKNESSAYLQPGTCLTIPPRFTTAGNYIVGKIQENPNNWTACSAQTPTFTKTITPGGPTFTPTTTPTPFSTLLVNCAGPQYTNAEGTWQADKAYSTGSWGYTGGTVVDRGSVAIGNTTDDTLYQTERYADPVEYKFDIPNGTYTVTFKMCESYWGNTTGGTGSRIFDIVAENNTVVNNLDLYATAGYNNAYDVTVNITVNDGQLNISMPADVDNGLINAIKIVNAASVTNTPTRTNTFTATMTHTNTFTKTFTHTFTRTNTFTATRTNTFTVTRTNTFTATRTHTFTATKTNTPIPPTNTFTNTATRTFTPVPPTNTFTNTATRTFTPVPPTNTFTNTATNTATRTFTPVPPTNTFTNTATKTFTPVPPTNTFTNTATKTFTNTATNTATNTSSNTPTITETPIPGSTDTFTHTITNTFTKTNTFTNTFTNTHTATDTHTATNTDTPVPPTNTFTNTPTNTFTNSNTATNTNTPTITNTPPPGSTNTFTHTITNTATNTFTSVPPTSTHTFTRTFTNTATNTFTSVPPTSTHTFTRTFTNTATNTFTSVPLTATHTFTASYTETAVVFTPTYTFTSTVTVVYTGTPTPVPTEGEKAEIKDVDVYPVPFDNKGKVYFEFTLTKSMNSVELKIYSSGYRLLKRVDVSSACVPGRKKSAIAAVEFGNLANGTYYFVLEGNSAEGFVRSRTEKMIILK